MGIGIGMSSANGSRSVGGGRSGWGGRRGGGNWGGGRSGRGAKTGGGGSSAMSTWCAGGAGGRCIDTLCPLPSLPPLTWPPPLPPLPLADAVSPPCSPRPPPRLVILRGGGGGSLRRYSGFTFITGLSFPSSSFFLLLILVPFLGSSISSSSSGSGDRLSMLGEEKMADMLAMLACRYT